MAEQSAGKRIDDKIATENVDEACYSTPPRPPPDGATESEGLRATPSKVSWWTARGHRHSLTQREREKERARLHRNALGDRDGAECPITKIKADTHCQLECVHPLPMGIGGEGTTASPL